ncbi:MAG TPA: serine--tRNA ligase, partial [Deltaproteobacteria bacterium]|nr:serine--tRNA ligase [Deltaproteobacteria bacterium]
MKFVRQNVDLVKQSLTNRGSSADLDKLLDLDNRRRGLIQEADDLKAKRNQFSAMVAKKGKGAEEELKEMRRISDVIKTIDQDIKALESDMDAIVLSIPNIPHTSVPVGSTPEDNPVVRVWGEKPEFAFEPKPHWDIGEGLGILDFKRAAKITGARFALNWGAGAKLERAIFNFMLDVHTQHHGCTEVWTPFMTNRDSMT